MYKHVVMSIISLFLFFPISGQAQDFAVNVEGRNGTSDELPIARIKITLEFDSAVPSSLELKRTGTSAATATLQNAPQSFGNGDHVRFRNPDPDVVEIELQPRSNFADWVGNKCDRAIGGTGEFNLQLDASTAVGDITGYRLTSYRALSKPYACQANEAQRRIIDTPANWQSQPPGENLGRHPIGIVMILDESGSMGRSLSSGESRMDRLHTLAGGFVDTWKDDGADDDQLGIVFFTTDTDPVTTGGQFLHSRSGGEWGSLASDIRSRSPQNQTAMGDGIDEAIEQSGTGDVSFLLFTDGIENTGDYRTRSCSELTSSASPCPANREGEHMNLYNDGTGDRTSLPIQGAKMIQTIGIGAPGSVQSQVLDAMSQQTGGKSDTDLPDQAMNLDTFLDKLLDILDAGTLQKVYSVSSTLIRGDQSGASRSVHVNRSASRLVTTAAWYGVDNSEALDIQFVDPSGQTREPDRLTRREDYLVAGIDLPGKADTGEWTISVTRGDHRGEIEYEVVTMLDEEVFRYQTNWHRHQYFTGDPMYLVLTLTENGQPTQELDPGDITVDFRQSGQALGNVLFETEVPDEDLEEGEMDSPGTPYGRKLQSLLDREELRERVQLRSTEEAVEIHTDSVQLSDGSTIGGSGQYVLTIPSTTTPGTYQLRLNIDGELEQSGRIQRTEEVQTQVQLRPNLANSRVEAKAADRALDVQFVPRDLSGKYLGPGYSSLLDVTSPDREEPYAVQVSDEETRGIYQMAIKDVPVDENPTLVFRVRGRPYHAVTVDQLVSGEIPEDPNLPAEDVDRGGQLQPCGSNENSSTTGLLLFAGLMVVGFVAYRRRRRT